MRWKTGRRVVIGDVWAAEYSLLTIDPPTLATRPAGGGGGRVPGMLDLARELLDGVLVAKRPGLTLSARGPVSAG
jgi:hypothetical protein